MYCRFREMVREKCLPAKLKYVIGRTENFSLLTEIETFCWVLFEHFIVPLQLTINFALQNILKLNSFRILQLQARHYFNLVRKPSCSSELCFALLQNKLKHSFKLAVNELVRLRRLCAVSYNNIFISYVKWSTHII